MKSKFLLAGTIAISLFSCVPSTQQTIIHRNKYVAPKEYEEKVINEYISQLDSKFSSPGFRGLHTGMTMDDINLLVKNTPWGYKYKPLSLRNGGNRLDQNWPDLPQSKEKNFLKGDKSKLGFFWSNIGCSGPMGKRSCYLIEHVFFQFHNGELASFSLNSFKWGANKIDYNLKPWTKAALKGLSLKYGAPTVVNRIEKVNIFDFKDGFETLCYFWDLEAHTIELKIGCYDHKYYSLVKFSDAKAASQIRKQKKEFKTNF